jgi:hypothetical protein
MVGTCAEATAAPATAIRAANPTARNALLKSIELVTGIETEILDMKARNIAIVI